jgi:hypothetical protein
MAKELRLDPETQRLVPPGAIGEIWCRSASVAPGYWERSELTARSFDARIGGEGPAFLRTGDLGAMAGAQLYVTGRIKDLIIIRGRNLYPQDLELTAESASPAVRKGCTAAVTVEASDGERVVIVLEVDRKATELDEIGMSRSRPSSRRSISAVRSSWVMGSATIHSPPSPVLSANTLATAAGPRAMCRAIDRFIPAGTAPFTALTQAAESTRRCSSCSRAAAPRARFKAPCSQPRPSSSTSAYPRRSCSRSASTRPATIQRR